MSTATTSSPSSRLGRQHTSHGGASLAVLFALAGHAGGAHAANFTVTFTDGAGKPLVDAVAMLEPAAAKGAVKPGADVEVSQAKRQFNPRVTVITTGTKVTFPNFDTVRHQVYSFSPIKAFELKLYAAGPGAPVTFDKPGVAVLGCNIHDTMAAWIVVSDTPFFARSAASGKASIESLPAGSYKLRVWHAGLTGPEPAPVAVTIGSADAEQAMRLAVTLEP